MRVPLGLRILVIVAAAIAPVLAVVVYNELSLRSAREAEVREIALQSARQTSLELERLASGTQSVLEAIAAAPVVQDANWTDCEEFLARLIERQPQFLSLAVLDGDGFPTCRSDRQRPNQSFSDRPYFKDAVANPMQLVIADYTKSRVSGNAVLPLSMAFQASGRTGVVVASLNLAWLQHTIENRELPPQGSVTVADRNGVIVARSPLPEQFVGTAIPDAFQSLVHAHTPGTMEVKSQDGTQRYLGYMPVSATPSGLYVSVGFGKDMAFADINAATIRTAVITAAALALAAVLAVLFSRSLLSGPIRRIKGVIDARRNGDMDARSNFTEGRGELEDLGAALDGYLTQIQEARLKQAEAERHRELLAGELAHRLKNLLATVQAIAGQTFRKDGHPKELLQQFDSRLQSIAAAQQLLINEQADGAELGETIRMALAPFDAGGDRFSLSGPRLRVEARICTAIALAFHELATNAIKYGALSNDKGRVDITWDAAADGELVLVWAEVGGPTIMPPDRKGFGSRMIEQLLTAELQGKATLDFHPAGLRYTIRAPLAALDPHR